MKAYPGKGSVFFKLARTLIVATILIALAVFVLWALLQLSGLPFVSVVLKFAVPYLWIVLVVYAVLWLAVFFSYNDFVWASRLCEAKESYDLGRYRKAVNFATFAIGHKKNCGLSYYLRSKAYEQLEAESLPVSDFDMAVSLGINPDKINL